MLRAAGVAQPAVPACPPSVAARRPRQVAPEPRVKPEPPPLLGLCLQRGVVAAALPLYERALAIWEASSGPDSPDVAHTLTDIAVIHLEQASGRARQRL